MADSDPLAHVWTLLESVTDPEIPVVSLREMGVLRAITQTDVGLQVTITPTYSGCPAMDQMQDDIVLALRQAGLQGEVITRLAPAWSSDWITDVAREKLRAYGIAPPQARHCIDAATAPQSKVIQLAPRRAAPTPVVPCPQCGSEDTTETSHFGSTACKALYRCLACREPFDYFKPY
jgi:ring-1,2-phenylacetyl-CoA epoxidase subunit PaaD